MKNIILFLLLPILCIAQKEQGQIKGIELVKFPIIDPTTEVPAWWAESSAAPAPPRCDDRERMLKHMRIDIDCDSITAEELGFDCPVDMGKHSAWYVEARFRSRGGFIYWLEPLTDVTPSGTDRKRLCKGPPPTGHIIVWSTIDIPVGDEVGMYPR
jgi:hypothetical protein